MNYRDMLLADYFDEAWVPAPKGYKGETVNGMIQDTDLPDHEDYDKKRAKNPYRRVDGKFKKSMKKAGAGAMQFARGNKSSSKLNKGLQIGGTAGIAAGAATASAGLAALNNFKKNSDAMYDKAQAEGKTNGLSREEWKAKKIKAIKASIGAGAATAALGGGLKAVTFAMRKHGNKKLAEGYDFEEAYMETIYDLEAEIYANSLAEALDSYDMEGYFDEGYEDIAIIEALNYADSLMLFMEAESTAAADIKCAFLETGDLDEAFETAEIISEGLFKKADKTATSSEEAVDPTAESAGGSTSKDKVKFTQRVKGWGKNAIGMKNGRSGKRTAGIAAAQVGGVAGGITAGAAAIKLAKLKKALKNGQITQSEYDAKSKKLKIAMAAGAGTAVAGTIGSVALRHTGSGKASFRKAATPAPVKEDLDSYLEDLNTTLYYDYIV